MRELGGHWLRVQWEALRGSYWFLPALLSLLGGSAALALLELDSRFAGRIGKSLPWVTEAGADGARATLSVVAGSMITVTGVVFSITVVALTLASSQFGPRLLRNFMRDRGNQLVLGTFIATFLFSLIVLGSIVAPRDGEPFVPHLAVTVAIGLGVTSLFVLVYFIHHTASSIQAASVIASVASELTASLDAMFPEEIGTEDPEAPLGLAELEALRRDSVSVRSTRSGYVLALDDARLLAAASKNDWVVMLETRPGRFVGSGSLLARVHGSAGAPADDALRVLQSAFLLGDHRTPGQDIEFLIDQLTEMAVRALSPGVNDPRTAVACVHRLGDALAVLAARPMPRAERFDEHGRLRVIAEPTCFAALAASAIDPIRRYGAGDPDIVSALQAALAEAAARTADPGRLSAFETLARDVRDAAAAKLTGAPDLRRAEAAFVRTAEALAAARGSLRAR